MAIILVGRLIKKEKRTDRSIYAFRPNPIRSHPARTYHRLGNETLLAAAPCHGAACKCEDGSLTKRRRILSTQSWIYFLTNIMGVPLLFLSKILIRRNLVMFKNPAGGLNKHPGQKYAQNSIYIHESMAHEVLN